MQRWAGERGQEIRERNLTALMWGVTPEIADMTWPTGTELLALDRSEEMIQFVWPGDVEGQRKAVCRDWLDPLLTAGGFDVVIGDGVFTLLRFPRDYASLVEQAHRALRPDGVVITRLFTRPETAETTNEVVDDLLAGRIGSFHVFKFRLAMSTQAGATTGVRMGDVYDAWCETGIDPDDLQALTGWSRGSISTIDQFRDKDGRLFFPTLAEFETVLDKRFRRTGFQLPGYEMGDRCPLVRYRKFD